MADRERADGELVRDILGGDETAFVELYRKWQGPVFRFALGMTGSRETAEDVTQDAFMILFRDGSRFDPERGPLGAYLRGIARNLVYRRFRRDGRHVELPEELGESRPSGEQDDPAAELLRREDVRMVRSAILELPARFREVVVLCELEGLSYAEAAAALGVPIGTVRSRLFRAREGLARRLLPAEERAPLWKRALVRLNP
jgi:RNA polymerase sigma-70 factor (ECF subfamily)